MKKQLAGFYHTQHVLFTETAKAILNVIWCKKRFLAYELGLSTQNLCKAEQLYHCVDGGWLTYISSK